jgi:hypothetical protein
MKRMIAPNDTMREVTINGARFGGSKTYGWSKDGTVHVESAAHVKALKDAGFTEAGVNLSSSGQGFKCLACGFHGWFKKCSRCGEEGERG